MTGKETFNIYIRRKIPFLSDFLQSGLVVSLLILLILSAVFIPTDNQSDEMKVAYFILVVPHFIQQAIFYTSISAFIFLVLYRLIKRDIFATLTFYPDYILITGRKFNLSIKTANLSKVFCMDIKDLEGRPKKKLVIYFEQLIGKTIRIKLKDYSQIDTFMNNLIQYNTVKFKFYDFDTSPDLDN